MNFTDLNPEDAVLHEINSNTKMSSKAQVEEALTLDNTSDRSFNVTILLNIFLGFLGFHRLYTKKIGTFLIMLLSTVLSLLFACILLVRRIAIFAYFISDPSTLLYYSLSSNLFSLLFLLLIPIAISIWAFVDLIYLINGNYKDKDEKVVVYKKEKESDSNASLVAALLICGAFGTLGLHRLYTKNLTSFKVMLSLFIASIVLFIIAIFSISVLLTILSVLILIALVIWAIIDFVVLATGSFTDGNDKRIER